MKFARPLLIAFGLVVVIIAAALLIALVPSVQRRLVLHYASGRPGLTVKIDHLSAGFSSIVVDGASIEKRGIGVGIGHLEMNYSLWSFLFRHRLSIRNLTTTGLDVDVSHTSRNNVRASVAGAPAAAPGMLTEIKLPFELVLDDCQISGRVLMPGSTGRLPVEGVFEIKGGKFSPGEEGALRVNATVRNPAGGADVGTLNLQLGLRAVQTKERNFGRVMIAAVVNAAGPSLSDQNQLKITSELAKGLSGENYSLSIDTLMHGTAENLLGLHAALPAGKNEYDGQWTIKARTAQLAPFFLGLDLPEFDARGEGRVDYAPATRATGLRGGLEVTASRLEAINPAWRAIGPIKLQAQFDVTADGPVARLRQLDLKLTGENPVLEFTASQAAEIDFSDRRLHLGVASGEALNLKLVGVPLAWLAPFLPTMRISGTPVRGEISITGGTAGILLRTTRPLHVDQLTLATRDGELLDRTAVTLGADAVLTDRDLKANINELTLQTTSGDLFKSQVNATIPTEADPPVSIQTTFTADLPTLLKPWMPKGHFKASGKADFSVAAGKVEVRTATSSATDASGVFLLKATVLRPFVFDPATRMANGMTKSPNDLAEIEIGKIPLEWLPLDQPGFEFGGTVAPTRFVLGSDGEKLSLRAVAPVKLNRVSLTQDGAPALSGLELEASPAFEMSPDAATVRTGDMSVRNSEGVTVFSGKGEMARSSTKGTSSNFVFNIEIPALAGQPCFAGTRSVSSGRASGEIRAENSSTRQLEARLTVNGLVAREGGQLLPVANLSFRALVEGNGKISLQAPLLLDRAGERSDLNFSLDVTPAGRTFLVNGKLTGDHVDLGDAASILGVFSSDAARATQSDASARNSAPAPILADKASVWSRFTGGFDLDVKSASLGKEWGMTGLTGTVAIDPTSVAVQKLEAAFGEKGRINAKAEIRFAAGTQPYRLTGDFKLTEFDSGKLFKAIEPGRPPAVEGLFNISGNFAGSGETLDRTITHTHGQFDLASRQGVFRGLQRPSGKLSMTSKAVEIGASVLGSLVGSEKATKAAEKVAGQAYFIDQFAQSLGEFNYDQLNVRLVRDESLNLKLEDIGLISPEIRLLGKGTVAYVAGKPLLEQPMNISLSLAARGKIEQLLGKLRLLDGSRDEVGYARTKETVTIGGSLAKPDPTAFFTRIASAKAADLLDSD